MRRKSKVDANQATIVNGLRRAGATVAVTSAVGAGFPDLVVGYRGRNFLLEIKDGEKIPSRRKLTTDQVRFHDAWKGQVARVESLSDALLTIGAIELCMN